MKSGDTRAAVRYAKALFGLALQRNELDAVAENLAAVTQVVDTVPDLRTVLAHPRITRERKREIVSKAFAGQVRPDVEHFLFLLIDKDRANLVVKAGEEFARLVDEHRKEVDAEAVTAVPLTEAQQAALCQKLQATTGYTVRLKTRVDENILGGMIVQVGDRLLDGSVAAQLQALHNQLRRAKVS